MRHKRRDVSAVLAAGGGFGKKTHFKSTLLKTVLSFKSCESSSTVGIGCLSLTIVSLARRMSSQTVTSPSPFVTTANGEIQPDGHSGTSSLMSACNSSSSFLSTFSGGQTVFYALAVEPVSWTHPHEA